MVFENTNGGIDVQASGGMSKLWLENAHVTGNGAVFTVRASNQSFLDIVYSTIASGMSLVAPIACTVVPQDNLILRNSLIVDGAMKWVTGCQLAAAEEGNFKSSAATLQGLIDEGVAASVTAGVVHAQPGGPLEGLPVRLPGDTPHDFDQLDVRSDEEDYAGADVP